jgi:tetratricopeptide (TPR) repeat protein
MGARRAVLGTFTTHDVAPFIVALPAGTRVTTAVANWAEYARLMVYPRDLVVDYGPAVVLPSTATDPAFWSGLVVGLGAVALALVAWRRAPVASLGILWFAAAVAPVSNIAVPIAQWVAERFLYLPSVGFVMVLASAATRWPRLDIRARRAVGTAAVLALLALSWRTWTRNATWETSDTVANTLIDEHPEAFRAQWLLGRALLAAGRTDPGFQALDNAIALNPNSMEPYTEKASWLLRLDRPGDAEALMRGLPEGRHADREATLVRALVRQGRRGEADLVLQEALARFPRSRVLSSLADSLAGIPPIP